MGDSSMKKEILYLTKLINLFSNQMFFHKSDLRNFYRDQYKELDEKTFRRILYSLVKDNIIMAVDSGTYVLSNEKALKLRERFVPIFSPKLRSISDSIQTDFPYTKNLIWETRILYENQFTGEVFLDPSSDIVEKYVFRTTESIIVMPLISRSPRQQVNGIPCPKLEKILVDVFADKEKFFIFQGQELVNIYETAFREYQISEKTLFWYADRRKVHQKIQEFITEKTKIQLIQQGEAN
jgi:hypothetical protein